MPVAPGMTPRRYSPQPMAALAAMLARMTAAKRPQLSARETSTAGVAARAIRQPMTAWARR